MAGPRNRVAAHVLIALQIAATLALLVGSALTLTSLYRLHSVDFGFDTRELTVTAIRPSPATLKRLGGIGLHERIVDRLRDYKELESVAAMSHVPLEPVLAASASVTTGEGLAAADAAVLECAFCRQGPSKRLGCQW